MTVRFLLAGACVISEIRKLRKFVACVAFGWKPRLKLVQRNVRCKRPVFLAVTELLEAACCVMVEVEAAEAEP